MKKPLVLAMLSGLILVGAAYPDMERPRDRHADSTQGGERYRPCRSRRDDNCIQLYERGVRAAYARWVRDGDPGYDEAVRYAVYRDRSERVAARRGHRDHLASDGRRHGRHAAAPAPRPRIRLATADVLRCDDRAAPRTIVRQRVQQRQIVRPAPAPAPRHRSHEDSGVRGM